MREKASEKEERFQSRNIKHRAKRSLKQKVGVSERVFFRNGDAVLEGYVTKD